MFGLRSARSRAIATAVLCLLLLTGVATTAAADRVSDATLWLLIGLSAAAFALAAATVAGAIVSTVRPLATLRASARAIADGVPGVRAQVSGPEEVASLARDFNAMTDALSAKTKEYTDTTNLTGVTLLRVDKDNRVTFLNDAMCEFLGRSREEILGTPIVEYLHPDDVTSTTQAVRQMVKSERLARGIVSRYVTPMGTRVTEWNGYPIFDEQGRYAGVHGAGRDISECKRAEEALRESEERLRILFEFAPDAYYLHDLEGNFVDGNRAAVELTGYKREELIGKNLLESNLFPPEQLPKAAATVAKLVQGLPAGLDEFTLIRKDGKHVAVETRGFLVKIGAQALVLGIGRDVSERKQAEQALREREHELAKRVKELNCLYGISVLVDKPGISLQEILQGTADLIPRSWQYPEVTCARIIVDGQEFTTANFKETTWRQTSNIKVGGQRAGSLEVYYLDKRPESDEGPFLKEERALINAVAERLGHISERKRAEEALRTKDSAIESSINGIALADPEGNLTYVNPSLLRMWGYDHDSEMLGRQVTEFWQAKEKAYAAGRALRDRANWIGELVALKKDGSTFDAQLSATTVTDAAGKPICIMGSFVDISERRRAEEALRESEEKYRLLAENVTDVIWTMDTNLRFTYVSPSVTRLRGYTVEEAMGQTVKQMLTPASLEVVKKVIAAEQVREQMEQKDLARSLTLEVEQTCKDGSTVWTEVTLTYLRDSSGRPSDILGITRDISERKRAEDALRESEDRHRAMFEQAADSIVLIDAETGALVQFNDRAHQALGYTREEFERLKVSDFEVIESAEDIAKHVERILREGADVFETKHRTKSGEIRDIQVSSRAVTLGGRHFTQGIWRDVTERKRVEHALRESEEKYRRLMQDSIDGIAIAEGMEITLVNRAFLEMFGYESEEEVVGHPFTNLVSPEYREIMVERGYAREKGEDVLARYEFKALRKDGSEFDADISVSGIAYKGRLKRQAVIKDISERKRAEEAVGESEEKFRNIFQSASDAIMYLDTSGRILDVNEKAVEVFGGPKEELLGKHFATIGVFNLRDIKPLMTSFASILGGEKASVEIRIKNRKGQERFLDCTGSSLKVDGRTPGMVVVAARDITERKQAEEALRAAREDIESRVERRMQAVDGYGLTFRELTILHLVAAGESDKEIATVLGISPLTAHKHLANILEKMGAASRTEAGVRALREGLLD